MFIRRTFFFNIDIYFSNLVLLDLFQFYCSGFKIWQLDILSSLHLDEKLRTYVLVLCPEQGMHYIIHNAILRSEKYVCECLHYGLLKQLIIKGDALSVEEVSH